ncbi:MAG: carboxypeptidase-like regulatory domain-containing protein [Pyrinomonadaceae bacterium]
MTKNFILLIIFTAFLFSGTVFVRGQNPPPPPPPKPVVTRTGTLIPLPNSETPSNSTVRGRAYFENTGRPVRRSSILLFSDATGPLGGGSGLTDNEGFFEIKNVAAGTYYPVINAPGVVTPLSYANLSGIRGGQDIKKAFQHFQPIEVNGINDVEVQIPARQGGAISGRVTYSNGDPAIGVRVEILRKNGDKFAPVVSSLNSIVSMISGAGSETDDRGMYRYSALPEGEYIIKVTEKASHGDGQKAKGGFNPFEMFGMTNSLLTVYYPGAFNSEEAGIVPVQLGQENYEVNLTIPDRSLFRLEGKVISDKDGKPIPAASFSLKRVGDTTASFFEQIGKLLQQNRSDEDGRWGFRDLPPGTYKLVIEPPSSGPDILEMVDKIGKEDEDEDEAETNPGNPSDPEKKPEPKYAKKIQEITIDDKNLSGLVIKLGYGATISGTVVTEKSGEMPQMVNVSAADESGETLASTPIINYSGKENPAPQKGNHDFQLENVPDGKILFQVMVSDEDFYVKSATLKNADVLTRPLELKEGDNLKGLQIVLSKDVGTVKGKVSDADKQPVKNTELALVPTDPARRRITSFYKFVNSDLKGEFTTKAAPGEYAIVMFDRTLIGRDLSGFYKWLDEVIPNAPKVKVEAGETKTVSFTLP